MKCNFIQLIENFPPSTSKNNTNHQIALQRSDQANPKRDSSRGTTILLRRMVQSLGTNQHQKGKDDGETGEVEQKPVATATSRANLPPGSAHHAANPNYEEIAALLVANIQSNNMPLDPLIASLTLQAPGIQPEILAIVSNPKVASTIAAVQANSIAASSLAPSIVPTSSACHNLIPLHLQASSLGLSLNGTPGHQPALIRNSLAAQAPVVEDPIPTPVLTVQDRLLVTPVFNGVNPNYPGLRVVNTNPPLFCVDNFLTPFECEFLVREAQDAFGPAPVVGKGVGEVSPSRTSSTCYLAREDLPEYMRKVSLLTGKPIEHCELPQVGRYLQSQQYLQHYDAFDLSNEDGRRFARNGGQRTITVLVYLNDVHHGGATRFPALNLDVQPRQGMALIFFPATVDGYLDKMALHAALPAIDTKFVSQVWIRQGVYNGQPSKRLTQTLGLPFSVVPPPPVPETVLYTPPILPL